MAKHHRLLVGLAERVWRTPGGGWGATQQAERQLRDEASSRADLLAALREARDIVGDPAREGTPDDVCEALWPMGTDFFGRPEEDARTKELAPAQIPEHGRLLELCASLADLDDGTGTLAVIVRQALEDDPGATAQDVRAIVAEAIDDAEAERAAEEDRHVGRCTGCGEDLTVGTAIWRGGTCYCQGCDDAPAEED